MDPTSSASAAAMASLRGPGAGVGIGGTSASAEEYGVGAPGEDPGAKKRRRRLVHEAHDHMGACDTCHLRRVRCVRTDPENPTCEACRKRGIKCTNLRNQGARYKARSGRNLDAAVAAFGSSAPKDPAESSTSSAMGAPIQPSGLPAEDGFAAGPDGQALAARRARSISEDSAEERLVQAEETDWLMASLMDTYIRSSTFAVPLVHWQNLQIHFDRAGRRVAQMSPMGGTLVLAAICFGAMFSDHVLIVGHGAPQTDQIQVLGRHANLSQWARKRRPFCDRLVQKVVDKVDSVGCFRIACTESVVALAMTADLIAHQNGAPSFEHCRPYWAAAVAHLRHMNDTNLPQTDVAAKIEWLLSVTDSYRSAYSGKNFLWTPEDLEALLPQDVGDPTTELISLAIMSEDQVVIARSIFSQWGSILRLNRLFAERISLPLLQNTVVDAATFDETLAFARQLFAHSLRAQDLVRASPDGLARSRQGAAFAGPYGSPSASHTEALPLAVATFVIVFKRHFSQWTQRRLVFREIGLEGGQAVSSPRSDEDDAPMIEKIDAELTELMAECVCLIARMLEERKNSAGLEICSNASTFTSIQYCVNKWASVALTIPCAERGGPTRFTREKQVWSVQTFIDAMRSQSWVWEQRQDDASACEAKLRRLKLSANKATAETAGAPPARQAGQALPAMQMPATDPTIDAALDPANYSSVTGLPRAPYRDAFPGGSRTSSFSVPYVPPPSSMPLQMSMAPAQGHVSGAFVPPPGTASHIPPPMSAEPSLPYGHRAPLHGPHTDMSAIPYHPPPFQHHSVPPHQMPPHHSHHLPQRLPATGLPANHFDPNRGLADPAMSHQQRWDAFNPAPSGNALPFDPATVANINLNDDTWNLLSMPLPGQPTHRTGSQSHHQHPPGRGR